MFCMECGNQLPEGAFKFCPNCGAKVPVKEADVPVAPMASVVEATPAETVTPVPVMPVQQQSAPTMMQQTAAPMATQPVGTPTVTQQQPAMVTKKKLGVDASYFKNKNYLMVLIGNLLAFVGCFVPFVSIWGNTVNLIELTAGGGSAVIIVIIVCVVYTFVKPAVVFIPCIISVCIYGANFITLITEGVMDALSIGAYLILVATVVALVGALKLRKELNSSAK